MHLLSRRATWTDIERHGSSLLPCYTACPGREASLVEFWGWMYRCRPFISFVVEDHHPPFPQTVALAAYAFVSDRFMERVSEGRPWLAGQLLEDPQDILDFRQVAEANRAGGLNVCVLHHAYPPLPLTSLPEDKIAHALPTLLQSHLQGYVVKDYVKEAFGADYRDWLTTSGMVIRAQTSADSWHVGIRRAEARSLGGARSGTIFLTATAKFGFSVPAQEMLVMAGKGLTDQELALELSISLSAVKKRWSAVYDRVDAVMPELLGWNRDPLGAGRGTEKRRRLLAYLQVHPEETNFVPTAGYLS